MKGELRTVFSRRFCSTKTLVAKDPDKTKNFQRPICSISKYCLFPSFSSTLRYVTSCGVSQHDNDMNVSSNKFCAVCSANEKGFLRM